MGSDAKESDGRGGERKEREGHRKGENTEGEPYTVISRLAGQ